MSEKIISALPVSAVSAVSPSNPPMYRSRKKLRMESHYFNTSLPLPISKTHEPRQHSIEKVEAVEPTFPTTKYKMNSNNWFQHAFGEGTDTGKTQASSAPYNGKTFNGRPEHYSAPGIGKTIPTSLKGFNQLYKVGDDSDDVFIQAGTIDFTRVVMDSLSPISIRSDQEEEDEEEAEDEEEGYSSRCSVREKNAAFAVVTSDRRSKKRSFPEEFVVEEDKQRGQARARIEENWEFGRALAKKHVHSLWRDSLAMRKRGVAAGEYKAVEERQRVRMKTRGTEKQLYDQKGNKSFLFLQVDVVMPSEGMVGIPPSPVSPM